MNGKWKDMLLAATVSALVTGSGLWITFNTRLSVMETHIEYQQDKLADMDRKLNILLARTGQAERGQ